MRDPRRDLRLKIVHAEPNDRATEIFTVQDRLAALSRPRAVRMTLVMPDVLEIDYPEAPAFVTDDVPARQVAVDEPQTMEVTHSVEEVFPANVMMGLTSRQRVLRKTTTDLSCGGN